MQTTDEHICSFGRFRLDTANKVLRFDGEIVALPLKSIELLCLLVENGGEVVGKQEIFDTIWADSFVEESVLTQNIYTLRKTFENYGETNLIKTVARRGYFFNSEKFAKIEEPVETENLEKTAETAFVVEREIYEEIEVVETEPQAASVLALPPAPRSPHRKNILIGAAALLLVALGAFAAWRYSRPTPRTSVADIKSIAVLPLKVFDAQKDGDENLRLRLMDSLITRLGKIESISVRPTSSMTKFLESDENSVEIGRKLLVDAVLEGSIQREANRLRVTLQLVSVETGEHIWADQFDGEPDRLLDLQSRISARMVDKLNLRLSEKQQNEFAARPTTDAEAYEEYLKGRYFWNKRTPENLRSAISSFETAVKLDETFADAYVGLADSYYLLFDYSYDVSPQNVQSAKQNLDRAIRLNPNLSDAYTTLGLIQTTYDWNWKEAEKSLKKAQELTPNSPNAHHRYGIFLAKQRRFDEAETELRTARSLDPTSASINMNLGFVLMNSKKYDEAVTQLRKTLELDENFTSPRWYLARCYWHQGDQKASLTEFAKAIRLGGDEEFAQKMLRDIETLETAAVVKNWITEWEKRTGPQGISDHDLAILNVYRGDKQETINRLEKSVAARHPWATWINAESEFDFIRDEPRFREILRKMNF